MSYSSTNTIPERASRS